MTKEECYYLGKITKPFGVKGQVVLYFDVDNYSMQMLENPYFIDLSKTAYINIDSLWYDSAIVDVLPVLGTGTVLLPWALFAFLNGTWGRGIGLLVLYIVITVVRQVIEPKIVDKTIGIPALFTLLGIFLGGKLMGILGILIVPLAFAVIKRLNDEVLRVEHMDVMRSVLQKSRGIVEADVREKYEGKLSEYKAKRDEREAKIVQDYRDRMKQYKENQADKEGRKKYHDRIVKTAGELSDWLLTNSDKEHVPEVLKAPLADLLSSIDYSSKRMLRGGEPTKADKKFAATLTRLNDMIRGQQAQIEGRDENIDSVGAYLDISEENREFLSDLISVMAEAEGTYTLNEMNVEQLEAFSKFLKNIKKAVTQANRTLANARYQNIPAMAQESMQDMASLGNASAADNNSAVKYLTWTNATPYYAFKRFGKAGEALFDGFTRGWEKLATNAAQIIDFTNGLYKPEEVRHWKQQLHDFELEGGDKVRMSTAQMMELAMLLKRGQAMKHIEAGGVRIGNIKGKRGKVIQDVVHHHLTANDISKILSALAEVDKGRALEVANNLQKYMMTTGARWGNEISMARFGYEFYTEGDAYYPIRTDANGRPMSDTDDGGNSMFRLLNLSASKSLNPKANNALIVGDIFDTFADHMSDMAKLNALGLPLLDAIKWFNYTEKVTNGDGTFDHNGVKKSMEGAFGTVAGKYFRTLLKDINGVKEASDRGGNAINTVTSNYKVAAVAANLRVFLLQPTSYVRAMAVIKPKHLASAMRFKNGYKEAMKYSGTAVWKSLGYYDTDIARSMRGQIEHDETLGDTIKEKSMWLAEKGDQVTWGRLWVAAKLEAKDRNPSLTGEALNQATADIFRETIYATQVMDSTLTRSEMMRGSTKWTKLATAFMAEPTLSYNLLMDAASQFRLDQRRTNRTEAWRANRSKIALAMTTYVCSAAASAIVESIVDAFRDDDDYEGFLDKFAQAFFGEDGIFDGNLWQDLTIVGKIPVAKDFIDVLKGNSRGDMSLAALSNIANAVAIWRETYKLHNGTMKKATSVTWNGKMTTYGKIYKTLQALSQLTGYAAANTTRDVIAIWNTIVAGNNPDLKLKTYDPGTKNAIRYALEDGYMTEDQAVEKLLLSGEAKNEQEAVSIVSKWKYAKDSDGNNLTQEEVVISLENGNYTQAERNDIWNQLGYKTDYADVLAKANAKQDLKNASVEYTQDNWRDGLTDASLSDSSKDNLVKSYAKDSYEEQYQDLRRIGYTPDMAFEMLRGMDTDANDYVKQAEAYEVLKGYPDAQAEAIWNSFGWKKSWAAYKASQH